MAFSFIGFNSVHAQTATFPDGCASALGYSVTDGEPCNGESTATIGPLPGCTTALGYSTTTGVPCSGGSVALVWLAGCASLFGYSTISGQPCNGTSVAIFPTTPPTVPGFPTTGAGGDAARNILLMLAGSAVLAYSAHSLIRTYQESK